MKDTGSQRGIGGDGGGVIVHSVDTLALRLAAAGGRIDDLPASQLVAAGFTLLQRSAPLVRLLARRRSGILLPLGPATVVALAASDGRGAVVLPMRASGSEIAALCSTHDVGAVFTTAAHRSLLPSSLGVVLLDQAPRTAVVCTPEGRELTVDLGSHVGLTVEGETDIPGRDEECLILPAASDVGLTHRQLLAPERSRLGIREGDAGAFGPDRRVLSELLLPLLAGAAIGTAS